MVPVPVVRHGQSERRPNTMPRVLHTSSTSLLAVGLSRFKPAALEDAPADEVEEETVELRFFVPAVPGGWAGSLARLARPVGASSLSTGLAQPRFKRVKWQQVAGTFH